MPPEYFAAKYIINCESNVNNATGFTMDAKHMNSINIPLKVVRSDSLIFLK
jgi:hypothetical protein